MIRWSVSGKVFSRTRTAGGSFLSTRDPRELIGLGKSQIDWVEVKWPAPSSRYRSCILASCGPILGYYRRTRRSVKIAGLHGRLTAGSPPCRRAAGSEHGDLWQEAKAALDHGQFAEARQLLSHAVQINPNDPALWFHLGVSCSQLNQVDDAINAFEKTRSLAPDKADVDFNLGLLYWRRGDVGKAKDAYRSRPGHRAG